MRGFASALFYAKGITMDIRYFDSHCHLDMEEFAGQTDEVLLRARDAGVRRVLLAACDKRSSFEVLRISAQNAAHGVEIWPAVGVHPHEAGGIADGLPGELTELSSDTRVAAIGEMGLDYYYDNSPRDVQAEVFARQIEWAQRANKPIIVHLRNAADRAEGDAYRDALRIMNEERATDCGGVIHCFSGELPDAKAALDLGFYLSFAGPLTYPKAQSLRGAAAYAPLDRILCETDSPYLAPQRYRGKRNEPAYVRHVYEKMAEVRGVPLADLAEALWENGERLFAPRRTAIPQR